MRLADSLFTLFLPIFVCSLVTFYMNLLVYQKGGEGILFSWAFPVLVAGAFFFLPALWSVSAYQSERRQHDDLLKRTLVAVPRDDADFRFALESKIALLEVEDKRVTFSALRMVSDSTVTWVMRISAVQPVVYLLSQLQEDCGAR